MHAVNDRVFGAGRAKAAEGMSLAHPYEVQPGQIIYRFVDVSRFPGPRVAADGPWWFEFEAFQQIRQFGVRHGYSLEYSARLHAAILYEWSEVTGFVRAEALQPVMAWKGRGKVVESKGRDPRDLSQMTPMQGYNEVYQLFIPGFSGGRGSLYAPSMRFLAYEAA